MPSMKNSAQIVLALIVAFGFFSCIFYMLNYGFPPENKDALNSLMGVLTTIFTLQQNFFFGSSSGSVAKDETIGSIAQSAPVVGTGIGNRSTDIPAKDVTVAAEGDVTINPKESQP